MPQESAGFQTRADILGVLVQPELGRRLQALIGTRGVGKTQLAAACARARLADGWRLVAWLNAETEDALLAGLTETAAGLSLAGPARMLSRGRERLCGTGWT